ncbi:hypothetical protein H072_8654 [Dactylellina haptotyla CBS 200.50]|uniref:NB-ARC domain-containing protein n=1 Tax=Dactylellina haptotyla (strain CBS 200.50) TaxID=1284197 RepID=S8A4C2_DACHA|nr:hypothetical protein H072_8654 [Dactylellina haptotyla CBS 200.50]
MKFAEENREKFWGVFWVDAISESKAERCLADIAKTAKIPEQTVESALRWLSNSKKPWLLIIDNADDESMRVPKFFPAGNRGVILVTTRNPGFGYLGTGWRKVGVMSEEESVTLLLKGISNVNRDEKTITYAKDVVNTLGCIPLAIAHASGAIRQNVCGLKTYCDIFARRRKRLMDHRGGDDSSNYEYTTYASWEILADFLKKRGDETANHALDLIDFFSTLHYTGISPVMFEVAYLTLIMKSGAITSGAVYEEEVLSTLFKGWGMDGCLKDCADPFKQAVTLLSSLSLIQLVINEDDCMVSLHPMVHIWTRDRLSDEKKAFWLRMSCQFLDAASYSVRSTTDATSFFRGEHGKVSSFLRSLLPHTESLLAQVGVRAILELDLPCDPPRYFGINFYNHGSFKQCEEIGTVGINFCESRDDRLSDKIFNYLKLLIVAEIQLGYRKEALNRLLEIFGGSQNIDNLCIGLTCLFNGNGWLIICLWRELLIHEDGALHPSYEPIKQKATDVLHLATKIFSPTRTRNQYFPRFFFYQFMRLETSVLSQQNEDALGLAVSLLTCKNGEDGGWRAVDPLRTAYALCMALWNSGQKETALAIAEYLVESHRELMGFNHIDTQRAVQRLEAMREDKAIPRELWVKPIIC